MPWYFYGKKGPATPVSPANIAVGTILPSFLPYSGTPPTGYLFCDGQSLIKNNYLDLFGAIGTIYGSANINEFNVPNFRGRTPRGVATSAQGVGDQTVGGNTSLSGGGAFGSKTHFHTFAAHDHTIGSHIHAFASNHAHDISHSHNGLAHTHGVGFNLDASLQFFGDGSSGTYWRISPKSHNHPPVNGTSGDGSTHNATAATTVLAASTGNDPTNQLDAQSTSSTSYGGFNTNSASSVPSYLTVSFLIKAEV